MYHSYHRIYTESCERSDSLFSIFEWFRFFTNTHRVFLSFSCIWNLTGSQQRDFHRSTSNVKGFHFHSSSFYWCINRPSCFVADLHSLKCKYVNLNPSHFLPNNLHPSKCFSPRLRHKYESFLFGSSYVTRSYRLKKGKTSYY